MIFMLFFQIKEDIMAPKKQKSKVQIREDAELAEKSEHANANENAATEPPQTEMSESVQATQTTVTTSTGTNKKYGASRGVSTMYKVVVKKAQGKKTKVRCDELGAPVGQNRHRLQSYIGMLARTIIPIDCVSWRDVDDGLKEKLWLDILVYKHLIILCIFYSFSAFFVVIMLTNSLHNYYWLQETFKVPKKLKKTVLKCAAAKWRQFKTNLNKKFVRPNVGQKKKLRKPPKQYAFVGKEQWKNFVGQRITNEWMVCLIFIN